MKGLIIKNIFAVIFIGNDEEMTFFKSCSIPGLYFVFLNKHYNFYMNKVHPVYSAGTQTHGLQVTSLLPQDQDSRPNDDGKFN